MTIDTDRILTQSNAGGCLSYNPDKTNPLGVKAHDISGLEIYACLNSSPTELGLGVNNTCGALKYCRRFEARKR